MISANDNVIQGENGGSPEIAQYAIMAGKIVYIGELTERNSSHESPIVRRHPSRLPLVRIVGR